MSIWEGVLRGGAREGCRSKVCCAIACSVEWELNDWGGQAWRWRAPEPIRGEDRALD